LKPPAGATCSRKEAPRECSVCAVATSSMARRDVLVGAMSRWRKVVTELRSTRMLSAGGGVVRSSVREQGRELETNLSKPTSLDTPTGRDRAVRPRRESPSPRSPYGNGASMRHATSVRIPRRRRASVATVGLGEAREGLTLQRISSMSWQWGLVSRFCWSWHSRRATAIKQRGLLPPARCRTAENDVRAPVPRFNLLAVPSRSRAWKTVLGHRTTRHA
jgi:hypothetical protein